MAKQHIVEEQEEQQNVPPGLFQQFGDFIAVCSDLEAETKQNELHIFLSKFGQIQFLWLEDINGLGNRQALVFFSSKEQLDNLIQNKYLNFTSLITVEQCSQQLKEISEMFLIEFYEKDPIQQKIQAQKFYEQGFIREIHNLLELIRGNQIERRIPQGRFLTLPANYHLITKISCYILSFIINLHPLSAKAALIMKIPQLLMNLLSTLPLYYVNNYHTQILLCLVRKASNESKQEMMVNRGLQTLSRLLDHTNLIIKRDVITIMFDIMEYGQFRIQTRTIHPLYSDAKNDGVIFQVYQTCLIHGETDFLKDQAVVILSTLMRGQEVDQKMKQHLFLRLKYLNTKEKPSDQVACMLDMLCGLAVDEGNIPEIISENFIKTVINHLQSNDQRIHHFALELLFHLAQKETELEIEIKNSIDIFDFLKLIGDSSTQFDEEILTFLMKHSDNAQLVSIYNLFVLIKRFILTNEQEKQQILTNEFIPTVLTILSEVNKQIIQQEQNNDNIQPLTLGLINCCCRLIIQAVLAHENSKQQIIKADILSQIVKILHHLQNRQIQPQYLEVFEIFTNINSSNYNYIQSRIDIIQYLSKILENPTNIYIQLATIIIFRDIKSGLSINTSSDNFKLNSPIIGKNTFFDALKNNGTIDILIKIAQNHNNSKQFTNHLIQILIYAFQGQQFPSELIVTTVSWLEEQIQFKLLENENIISEIPQLVQLSCHQRNIETIMNSKIIKLLYSYIDKVDSSNLFNIIQLFNILLINGNENTPQKFKAVISIDQLESLIKRQNYAHLFDSSDNNEQKQKYKKAISEMEVNRKIFTLIAWYLEEDKMNKLSKQRNELISLAYEHKIQNEEINNKINSNKIGIEKEQDINKQNQIELFEKNLNQNEENIGKMKEQNQLIKLDDIQNQQKNENKEYLQNNYKWDIVKKMILITNEFRDKELSQGVIGIVREAIYIILFDQLKNSKEIELINSVKFFHQLIENSDNQMCFNLIDQQIFEWFIFSIKEYYHRQQFDIVENIISLFTLILKRGVIMGNYREFNHFFSFSRKFFSDFLQKILEEKQNDEDNDEIKQLKERIQLQVAIYISCIHKKFSIDANILNICSSLFFNYHEKFNQQLQKNSLVITQQLNLEYNQASFADSSDVETLLKVLTSISCLAIHTNQNQILVNQHKIHEVIFPLIHLNCSCPLKFTHTNQKSASDVVSSAFDSLSFLVLDIKEDEINEINLKHKVIDHLKPFIMKSSELDIQEDKSHIDSFSIIKPLQYAHHSQFQSNSALKLLSRIILKSKSIEKQVYQKPSIINLIKISIAQVQINPQKQEGTSNAQEDSLQTENSVINSQATESLNEYEDKIDLSGIASSIMSDANGISNDEDYALCRVVKNICFFILRINNNAQSNDMKRSQQINKLKIGIKEKIEEDGIEDEDDALLFHTDTRSSDGVRYFAQILKDSLNT